MACVEMNFLQHGQSGRWGVGVISAMILRYFLKIWHALNLLFHLPLKVLPGFTSQILWKLCLLGSSELDNTYERYSLTHTLTLSLLTTECSNSQVK